jgi:hypothetical protein
MLFVAAAILALTTEGHAGAALTAASAGTSPGDNLIPFCSKDLFLLGMNYPYINYGHDFGTSAWGHDGVSAALAGWWEQQTYTDSQGITKVVRSSEQAHDGRHSLKLIADLVGGDPHLSMGEAFVDLTYHAPPGVSAPVNLEGVRLQCWVYAPENSGGDPDFPNGLQLLVQDENWNTEYGTWVNIHAGQWNELTLTPGRQSPPEGWMDAGFDPAHIVAVGVKAAIDESSSARFQGAFYLDSFTVSGSTWFDFEDPSVAEADFQEMARQGIRVVRWFVFADGTASPEFDQSGRVTGFDSYFYDDMDAALEAAREKGIYLVLSLFDFYLCDAGRIVDGVQVGGHSDLIADPVKRQSFIDSALKPMLARYGADPQILAWEVINEPEWAMAIPGGQSVGQPVSAEAMQDFVRLVAEVIKENTTSQLVTVGSASRKWLGLWKGLGLDFYQYHYYDWMETETPLQVPFEQLGLDKPCILGEFPTAETAISIRDYLETAWSNGLAGALGWSFRGEDESSVPREQFSALVAPAYQEWRQAHPDVSVDLATFPDVPCDHWALSEVEAIYRAGITVGYPDGLYHPSDPVTRAQMAVYISRALADGDENVPEFTGTPSFTDVGPDHWGLKYIEYAVSHDVVQGYDTTHYVPDAVVDRGQMAVFVARSQGWVNLGDDMTTAPQVFPDVPAGFWAGTAVKACVDHGVVQGYLDGLYHPSDTVTRDQMAVYVARAFQLPM